MKFMNFVHHSLITISPNRQRREFKATELNDLVESITKHGLFHAIVLRKENDAWVLVSGERRLRAMQDIWALGGTFRYDGMEVVAEQVPFVNHGELSALDAEEAELEENIRREDLTWAERAEAVLRLNNLRDGQAQARGLPRPSVADLALEVRGSSHGKFQESTRRELIVARHLDNPEVRAAKTVDEAYKVLKRSEEASKNAALAASVGATFSSRSHTAIQADALSWLVECPDESFDVILTDPPYGMGADEFGDSGGKAVGAHGYADDEEGHTLILTAAANNFYRIAKPQAHLYVFCDIDWFSDWKMGMEESGWWVHRTPIIWHKPQASRIPWAEPPCGPQRKWEMILYAVKGKRPMTRIAPDLVSYNPDTNLGHSAQKPVNLFIDLLSRSVRPGDTVIDPFAGTGTLIPAAHELKCRATVVEKDAASFGTILKRLEALDEKKELA